MFAPRFEYPEWEEVLTGQPMAKYEYMQGDINRWLSEICRDTGVVLIPLQTCFLREGRYQFSDEINGKYVALYRDSDHLTGEGSRRAATFVMDYIFQYERNNQ